MSQVLAKAVKGVPLRGMLLGAPGAELVPDEVIVNLIGLELSRVQKRV
ncbi:hypothetical protein AYI69_g6269, partial [Smittium culicis]